MKAKSSLTLVTHVVPMYSRSQMTRYRTALGVLFASCCLILALSSQAKAVSTMHIDCTGTTSCAGAGGALATQSTGTNPPTFDVTNTGTTGLTGTIKSGTVIAR